MEGYNRPGAPLTAYFIVTSVWIALLILGFFAIAQLGIDIPRISILDMVLLGVATHKVSWLVSGDVVLSFLRAPFTRFHEPMGPGAVLHEMARGSGMKFALGEMLTCPWCVGLWISLLFVFGLIFFYDITRAIATIFAVLMLADFLQIIYMKAGKDIVHYADPKKE